MSLPTAFDFVSDELARQTGISALEARGTLRLLLKNAGIDSKRVNRSQLAIVVARLLLPTLARLRVAEPQAVCERLTRALSTSQLAAAQQTSPEEVFGRLGRR